MILTDEETKTLSESSDDTLAVIRNTEAAVLTKLCAGVEIPEPFCYVRDICSPSPWGTRTTIWSANPPDMSVALYTADQLRTAIAAERESLKALEALQAEIEQWEVDFNELLIERDSARERLAELKAQEPIAIYSPADNVLRWTDGRDTKWPHGKYYLPAGVPEGWERFYAAAGASPQPVQPSQAGELSESELLDSILRHGSQELVGVATYRTSHMGAPETVRLSNSTVLILNAIIAAINAKGAA